MWNLCIYVGAWAELPGITRTAVYFPEYLESRQQFKDVIEASSLKACHRSATNKRKLNGCLYLVHFLKYDLVTSLCI